MTENTKDTPITGIKFTHAEDGVIDIYSETALTHLLAIGAVVKSRKRLFGPDGRNVRIEYPTDRAGLETLASSMNGSVSVLTGWISLLGKFMVNTDIKELDEGDFAQYGWLIAGLSELVCQLNYEAGEIQYALKQDRE